MQDASRGGDYQYTSTMYFNVGDTLDISFVDNGGDQFYLSAFEARSTVVPEPASLLILSLGMLGLGFARFTRKS